MLAARIDELAAALAAEQAARVQSDAALAALIEGSTDSRVDRLLGAIERQGEQIAELSTHVGLLAQAVAQLLGEDAGQPVQEEDAEAKRVDLDGNPY